MIDVTEAESLPLDARVIESGLARLWQLAADGSAGGVVHASSLTLVASLPTNGWPRVPAPCWPR